MKVKKVINNNLVCSTDERGREVLVMGKGLGFKKKRGDSIDTALIEKVYRLDSGISQDGMENILARVPLDILEAVTEIVAAGEADLHTRFGDGLLIHLTDHVSYTLERHSQGLTLHNALLGEIRSFYPREYDVGKRALTIIRNHTGVSLAPDEAGFIAMHFISGTGYNNSMEETSRMMQLIRKVLSIVMYSAQIRLDTTSIQYERFLTHLKYFSRRLFSETEQKEPETDPGLYQIIKSQYKKAYLYALKVEDMVRMDYGKGLNNDEMIYLTIHINRLIEQNGKA